MKEMKIQSYKGGYKVNFVEDLRNELPDYIDKDFWVILDNNVGKLYEELLSETLSGLNIITIEAKEDRKSYYFL